MISKKRVVAGERLVPEVVVLDANILIRAVLGRRVREILETHITRVRFFAPDTAFSEAREHLPEILEKRAINPQAAVSILEDILVLIGCIRSLPRNGARSLVKREWPGAVEDLRRRSASREATGLLNSIRLEFLLQLKAW
jgi:predicted nucleic acid-binding protein